MLHWTGYPPLIAALAYAYTWYLALRKDEKYKKVLTVATALLAISWLLYLIPFVTLDFSLHEVYWNSSEGLPLWMRIATSWSGGGGSLFLFTFIAGLTIYFLRGAGREFLLLAIPVLLIALFAAYMNDAFTLIPGHPVTGAGLNPLLKSPWLYPHPLSTFSGYAILAISAIALALGYKRGRASFNVGWALLTIGIMLGAYWSYETFGWGGYWAWDPVETSELLVWLTSTVYPHTVPLLTLAAETFAPLITSSVFLAMFVTRTGLSPLHSFAGANMGSMSLFLTAIAFLVWWLKKIADNFDKFGEIVTKLKEKKPYYVGTLLGFTALFIATIFVYATLFVPSVLISLGKPASVPQMSSGIKYFHPVLYPLLIIMLLALPMIFLNDLGWKAILTFEIAVIVLAASMAIAALKGTLTLAYLSPKTTNAMMAFGIPIATFTAITALYYIYKRYKLIRDWGITLVHFGMAITALGIFLSGTYAFNNSYFFTFHLIPGTQHKLPNGMELKLLSYHYKLSNSLVDIKSRYIERTTVYFYGWLALKTISQDLSPYLEFIYKMNQTANREPLLRLILDTIKENKVIFQSQGTVVYNLTSRVNSLTANVTEIRITNVMNNKTRIIRGHLKVLAGPSLGVMYLTVGRQGTRYFFALSTSGFAINTNENLTTHDILYVKLEKPITLNLGKVNVTAKAFTVYPMGNVLKVHGITSYVMALLIPDGNIMIGKKVYPNGGLVTANVFAYVEGMRDPIVSSIMMDKQLYTFLRNPKDVEALITPPKGYKCLHPGCEGYVNAPQYIPETIKLQLNFQVINGGHVSEFNVPIRYEAYGEIQGIHGLVPKVVHPSYGFSDLYVALNPPVVTSRVSQMISYHDLLLMYMHKVLPKYKLPQRLALAALFAAGYNINVIKQWASNPQMAQHLPTMLELATLELYLLSKNYHSHISTEGLYVQAKVIPGVPLVWIGPITMALGALLGAIAYKRPRLIGQKGTAPVVREKRLEGTVVTRRSHRV